MKRFFLMILVVSVFFTGLGGMFSGTAAKLKSDEKALAILQKARQAIGGDSSLAVVNSLVVTGKSTRTLRFGGQTPEKTIQGDMELALQFPDKMMKSVKMINNDGAAGEKSIDHQVDVVIVKDGDGNAKWKTMDGEAPKPGEGKKIIIKKEDGTTEELQPGKEITFTAERVAKDLQAEMSAGGGKQMVFSRTADGAPGEISWQTGLARTALSLLLTTPQGMDVFYLYGGEENVDGTVCHVINAQIGGAGIRLFIGRDSNLPVMMSYQDAKPMVLMFRTHDNAGAGEAAAAGGDKQVKVFTRQAVAPEMADFQVKFSDYRSVNGVQLPYKWTQTMGGQPDEVIDVTSYEINPVNIAEKFKGNGETKVFIRKAKEQ
ncbi:MAG TPA: hypothetical protein VGO50_17725 [Pyrinomonadaceae bacterium]|jgi:hypothetical protein|nr:hypothetical protein [Pyrinomonadaceae bacterium]